MARYITELLKDANEDPSLLSKPGFIDNYAIKTLMQYAFDKSNKMNLPEGAPPYKKDTAPLGMSPANFYQQVKKLYVFKRTDVAPIRLEAIFIQMLESLHPSEADVVIAIKDQNLESIYPNITSDVVVSAGYVSKDNIKEGGAVVAAENKSEGEGKNLVLRIDESAGAAESFGKPPEDVSTAVKKRGRPRKVKTQ